MKMPLAQTAPLVLFSRLRRPSGRRGSFTLVELVVAIAILSIMLLALASMMGFVIQTWLAGVNAVNNFTKARTMLTMLDRDTQLMVLRRDLGAFADQTNGPVCAFYTKVQGQPGTDTRAVSLVQYSLVQQPTAANATNSILQRINGGMNFTPASGTSPITPMVGTAIYSTNLVQLTNTVYTAAAAEPDNVATGVIAFQWQFIDGNGKILPAPYSYTPAGATTPVSTAFFYDFTSPSATYNPRTLVISLVVLSDNAYNMAQQTSTLPTLIAQFPTTLPGGLTAVDSNGNTYDTETYAQYWNSVLNPAPPGTFPSGAGVKLPAPEIAAGTIQVFERDIPLPLITPSTP